MSDPPAPEKVLGILAASAPRLAEATAGAGAQRLRTPPEPGAWSAVEVLAHLRACADVWGGCIERILGEDEPTIRATNPTTWIERTDYRDLGFDESFRAFAEQRGALLRTLRALSPEQWQRAATVTGAGRPLRRTVLSYAEWLATHERPHVKQIARAAAGQA